MKKNNIIVLGCGITGMITALSLAKHDIPVTIVESSTSQKFPLDVRTTTFTNHSKRFLEEVGIWNIFENNIGLLHDIYIVDSESPKMLHLEREDNIPKGYVIENMLIKERLYDAVTTNALITLEKGVSYDMPYEKDGKVHVGPYTTDILLVCEGRNSLLHEIFPARLKKSYKQIGIVLVCEHEKEHEGTAVEHFMPHGPFASLPMKNPRYSSIVWTEPLELADLYKSMPTHNLNLHLQEKMGEFLGKVKIISDVQVFPLTARITKQYYQGNIILVGDAAHSIHPLAGQGLNQGIKDIEEIVSIFSKRIRLGIDINEVAYQEYENKRSRDNMSMFLVTDNLNRIFSNSIFPLSSFRKIALSILNEAPLFKKFLSNAGSGNKSHYWV
ncbi:MAG UNVERIFIED_CONTAM: FAD-dependent monooxygenase [Rickettsiaceae bacterium]|jgi:2-octaprenyl-6-methoxyphenol hydroxylase